MIFLKLFLIKTFGFIEKRRFFLEPIIIFCMYLVPRLVQFQQSGILAEPITWTMRGIAVLYLLLYMQRRPKNKALMQQQELDAIYMFHV
jgi:hypothetical protein